MLQPAPFTRAREEAGRVRLSTRLGAVRFWAARLNTMKSRLTCLPADEREVSTQSLLANPASSRAPPSTWSAGKGAGRARTCAASLTCLSADKQEVNTQCLLAGACVEQRTGIHVVGRGGRRQGRALVWQGAGVRGRWHGRSSAWEGAGRGGRGQSARLRSDMNSYCDVQSARRATCCSVLAASGPIRVFTVSARRAGGLRQLSTCTKAAPRQAGARRARAND